MFFILLKTNFNFWVAFILSYGNSKISKKYKILLFGKELSHWRSINFLSVNGFNFHASIILLFGEELSHWRSINFLSVNGFNFHASIILLFGRQLHSCVWYRVYKTVPCPKFHCSLWIDPCITEKAGRGCFNSNFFVGPLA